MVSGSGSGHGCCLLLPPLHGTPVTGSTRQRVDNMKFVFPVFRQAMEIEGVRRRIRRVVEGEKRNWEPFNIGISQCSTDRHSGGIERNFDGQTQVETSFSTWQVGPGKCFFDDKNLRNSNLFPRFEEDATDRQPPPTTISDAHNTKKTC